MLGAELVIVLIMNVLNAFRLAIVHRVFVMRMAIAHQRAMELSHGVV